MAAEHRRRKSVENAVICATFWGFMIALFAYVYVASGPPGGHHPAPRVTNVSVERFLTDARSGKMSEIYAPRGESDVFGEMAPNRYERLVVTSSVAVLEGQRFVHLGVPVRWTVPRSVAARRAESAAVADSRMFRRLLLFFVGPIFGFSLIVVAVLLLM